MKMLEREKNVFECESRKGEICVFEFLYVDEKKHHEHEYKI